MMSIALQSIATRQFRKMGSRRKPRNRSATPEEFEDEPETGSSGSGPPLLLHSFGLLGISPGGTGTSYDLLAQRCGCTSSNLKEWATIHRLKSRCLVYKDIEEYVKNSSDGMALTVQRIYKIERKGEREPFSEKYRILLWHGTSPSAVGGIIQTGFRKGFGGNFGGGIYFADRIAKSAGYTGGYLGGSFFILAEVSPGRVYKSHHGHSDFSQAPPGFDIVKGTGSNIPTWKQNKFYKGAILPVGVTKKDTRYPQHDMAYSEYIVYDPNRIIVRFVVECS